MAKLTKKQAKAESLEKWGYYKDFDFPEGPDLDGGYLPESLRKKLESYPSNCPLCELFYQKYNCHGCPLFEAGQECTNPDSIWDNWAEGENCKENAEKIYNIIDDWEV